MKTNLKKIVSIFLVVLVLAGSLSAEVLAEESNAEDALVSFSDSNGFNGVESEGSCIVESNGEYTIIQVEEPEVPLAFHISEHVDNVLPLLFLLLTFGTQLYYYDRKKKYRKDICVLKKKLGIK